MGKMTDSRAAEVLAAHNEWRRGGDGPQTDPTTLGLAIDHAIARLREPAEAQAQGGGEAWRPMDTAPRDGTLLRLLVDFDDHPTDDTAGHAPTIGANSFDDTGEDVWKFAGWCWSHDHFTEGKGTPVGWLPMLDTAPPSAPVGVGGLVTEMREAAARSPINNGVLRYWADKLEALAQQPAAVDDDARELAQWVLEAVMHDEECDAMTAFGDAPRERCTCGCSDAFAKCERILAGPQQPAAVGGALEDAVLEVVESINRFRDEGTRPHGGTLTYWEATLRRALAAQHQEPTT